MDLTIKPSEIELARKAVVRYDRDQKMGPGLHRIIIAVSALLFVVGILGMIRGYTTSTILKSNSHTVFNRSDTISDFKEYIDVQNRLIQKMNMAYLLGFSNFVSSLCCLLAGLVSRKRYFYEPIDIKFYRSITERNEKNA